MATTARAVVCHDTHANNGWKMQDVHVRKPKEGELLVEMVASGICHTDVLVGDLPAGAAPIAFYPRVLGHEGSGYVKAVGPGVTVAKEGDPVLLSFAFCKKCTLCKAGHYSHCNDFMPLNFGDVNRSFGSKEGADDIGGCFFGQSSFGSLSVVQQCSVVNAKDLVKSKDELELFSPLGCGIQTGSGTIVNTAQATADDTVVITGMGGVGLSAVMGAAVQKCKTIIGVDLVDSRLKLAKELGATHTINSKNLPEGKSLADAIKELTGGEGASISVDTTGVPAVIKQSVDWTRNRAKIIQVGSAPFDFKLEINAFEFMCSGKQFIGAIEGQAYPPVSRFSLLGGVKSHKQHLSPKWQHCGGADCDCFRNTWSRWSSGIAKAASRSIR